MEHTKRNGEIDILRFIFAFFIFLHHFGFCAYYTQIAKNGWLGVEFFFLLTGYFLARTAKKIVQNAAEIQIANQTWKYICNKIKTFYPYYFLALVVKIIFVAFTRPFDKTAELLFKSIPTFTLLFYPLNWYSKGIYITDIWFLSAMITSIFILFPLLLYRFENMSKIVFPIVSFFMLGFLLHTYKTLNIHGQWSTICYSATLRATAEIMFGVFLFQVVSFANTVFALKTKHKLLLTVVKYALYAVLFLYIVGGGKTQTRCTYLIVLCCCSCVVAFAAHIFDFAKQYIQYSRQILIDNVHLSRTSFRHNGIFYSKRNCTDTSALFSFVHCCSFSLFFARRNYKSISIFTQKDKK